MKHFAGLRRVLDTEVLALSDGEEEVLSLQNSRRQPGQGNIRLHEMSQMALGILLSQPSGPPFPIKAGVGISSEPVSPASIPSCLWKKAQEITDRTDCCPRSVS